MTKQGIGVKSEVSKVRDTAVVDLPPIRITAVVQRSSRTGGFQKEKPGNGKYLMGHTHRQKLLGDEIRIDLKKNQPVR